MKTAQTFAILSALLGTILIPQAAAADDVLLTSSDGSASIRGEFAGTKDNAYVIIYNGHELLLPSAEMTCTGDACPQSDQTLLLTTVSSDS
jgi:hypothetical protein